MRTRWMAALTLVACTQTEGTPGDGSTGVAGSSSSSTTSVDMSTSGGVSSGESSSTGEAQGSSSGSPPGTGTVGTGTGTGTGTAASPCYPDGIYGPCSTSPGCQCLQGATVYQVCTANCEDVSECGDAADFPGAMPVCAPINPGSPDMICALVCTRQEDCPCGLVCMPSGVPNTNICAEAQ